MVGTVSLIIAQVTTSQQLQIKLGRELGAEAFAEEDGVAVHEETEAALDAID